MVMIKIVDQIRNNMKNAEDSVLMTENENEKGFENVLMVFKK